MLACTSYSSLIMVLLYGMLSVSELLQEMLCEAINRMLSNFTSLEEQFFLSFLLMVFEIKEQHPRKINGIVPFYIIHASTLMTTIFDSRNSLRCDEAGGMEFLTNCMRPSRRLMAQKILGDHLDNPPQAAARRIEMDEVF